MKVRSLPRTCFALGCALLLSGCGGGGGGGGSSRSGSAPTGIRVLHSSLDSAPVQVFSSLTPSQAVATSRFGGSSQFAALSPGSQTVTVRRGANDALFTSDLNVERNQHYSLLFYQSAGDLSPRFTLNLDPEVDVPKGMAAIRVAHAVAGASSITVITESGERVAQRVPFGSFSEYFFTPARTATITVIRDGDGRIAFSAPRVLSERQAYSLVVQGEIDYFVNVAQAEDR